MPPYLMPNTIRPQQSPLLPTPPIKNIKQHPSTSNNNINVTVKKKNGNFLKLQNLQNEN